MTRRPDGEKGSGLWVPEKPAWWQDRVVYQIYPRSFFDASGDGIGDLAGIQAKIDYLSWLGIGAVWLSPIYPTEDIDLGYDISEYREVDPRLGSMADFDDMLDALHARDIKLVLDLVPNHTSDRHEWFLESRSGPDNPRHDWYVWRAPGPEGSPPNNWESYFGGPAWDYLEPPGKWYLHSFHRGQPDLNWDNPEVRNAIRDVMRFWLDRGVDGFRVDVLWLLGKDPELRDNSLNPDWHEGAPSWLRLRRDRSEDGPRAHEYVRFLRHIVDEYRDRVMIGEVVLPPERAVAYYGTDLDEANMPHNFALTEVLDWRADEIRAIVESYETVLPARAWPNWLLGDHDFPRIASRVGRDRTRLVHMLLLTLRGTPTWYYGDELGIPNAQVPLTRADLIDPQAATGPDRDRLAARTPMQWSNDRSRGFSSAEPWLPLASADPKLTVEAQRDDPTSVLSLFRSLVALRKELPALRVGAYESLPARSDVFSFRRHHPTGSIDVHLNFGEAPREVELGGQRKVLLSTMGRPTGEVEGSTLRLESREGVIMRGTYQGVP